MFRILTKMQSIPVGQIPAGDLVNEPASERRKQRELQVLEDLSIHEPRRALPCKNKCEAGEPGKHRSIA